MSAYYEDELTTLFHGDCLEIDAWLKADALVTDPPYGISHKSGGGPRGRASWKNAEIANDESTTTRDRALDRWGTGPALMFGSWKRPRPATTRAMLIWDKGLAAGMGDLSIPWKPNFEEVYVLGAGFVGKRESGVLTGHAIISWESSGRTHPHEKPLSLMCALIEKCPPGQIADPFSGSGTTLVAAKLLGRRAIGVEIDERHCEVAAKRLAQDVLDFGEAS